MQLSTVKVNLLSIHEKKARSTKHQVHFGVNHAISILISTLIDIIFVIFKHDRGILDYNKMQPRPKMFCVFSSWYLFLFTVCDYDISWSFLLFSKHIFSGMIKYFYCQNKEQVVVGKHI